MDAIEPHMGVFITHNADYAAELNATTPIIAPQPLRINCSGWHPLPLTERLGIPLQALYLDILDRNGPKYYNETLAILSIDPYAPSASFCKPTVDVGVSVFVRRADGKDLDVETVEAMVEYVAEKMRGLVKCARDGTDGEGTESEDGEEREGTCPVLNAMRTNFEGFRNSKVL